MEPSAKPMTPERAKDILEQIEQGRWSWLKVKRWRPEAYQALDERFAAFEQHHAEETGRMIEIIKELCVALTAKPGEE